MTDEPTERTPRPRRPDSRTHPSEQIRAVRQWRSGTDDAGDTEGWRHDTAELPRITEDTAPVEGGVTSGSRAGARTGRVTRGRRRLPVLATAGFTVLAVVTLGAVGSALGAFGHGTSTDPVTTEGSAGTGQGAAVPDITSTPTTTATPTAASAAGTTADVQADGPAGNPAQRDGPGGRPGPGGPGSAEQHPAPPHRPR